jgi:hypothetical protein
MDEAAALTEHNRAMTLTVAFNYGGRAEIVDAIRSIVASGIAPGKIDERTEEQKKADLTKALQEAEQLSKKPGITEGEVKAGLPSIKQRYKMVSLTLVVDKIDETGEENIHFDGEINPKATSGESTLTSDKNKKITGLVIARPTTFKSKTSQKLNPKDWDLVKKKLDRRHVVSSNDMATHYETNLNNKTWAQAKKLLDPKLSNNKLPVVEPLTDKVILARVKALHKAFFNDLSNLFLGDSSENRSIQEAVDPHKPGMGMKGLDDHIAKMEEKYAIGELTVTGYND